MKTSMLIDATTSYKPQQVRRSAPQHTDYSGAIRFATYAMFVVSFGYIAFKTLSSVGVM
ncbi:MAG: hypothetical protein WCW84_14530 [Sulfurimonas sp.]